MTPPLLFDEEDRESDTPSTAEDEIRRGGDTDSGSAESVDRLPKDVIFGLLSNERRRLVLRYLVENENPTTLSDLAEHIASTEKDKPVADLTSSERKRVYIGLYQCHLPKMDDASIIDYNKARGRVQLRPEADQALCYFPENLGGANQHDSWLRDAIPSSMLALGTRLRG